MTRAFLLAEGTDARYKGRHLKDALERHPVFPFANLMATGQTGKGDVLVADHDPLNGHLSFAKRAWEALVHVAAA